MTLLKTTCALVAFAIPTASHAVGVELVTNGGFETGDLTGWACTGADLCEASTASPRTGTYSMIGFDNDGFATLSQTVATNTGVTYDFSFWSSASDEVGNILTYALDGFSVVGGAPPTGSYGMTSDSFVATGTTATISFFFETDGGTGIWAIDDVSVMEAAPAVPLPASLPLLGAGLAGLALARRRRKTA